MPDLKLFLHQQNSCHRIPQLQCDYCGTLCNFTVARYSKTEWKRYTGRELSVGCPEHIMEDPDVFSPSFAHYVTSCSIELDETFQKFHSNFKYFTQAELKEQGVKYFILSRNDDIRHDSDMTKLRSLSHYVKVHPFKKLFLRAIPVNSYPENERVFTEEVLEIVQILSKIDENDDRLLHYRRKWPAEKDITIGLVELKLLLENFDVDKSRITITPDISHAFTLGRMLNGSELMFLQVPSPRGTGNVMRPHHLVYLLFRRVVCRLNWRVAECLGDAIFSETFRALVLGKMKEYAGFEENAYISTVHVGNALQYIREQWLSLNKATVTSMYTANPLVILSKKKNNETIDNNLFRTASTAFGFEDIMKDHEEWCQDTIPVDKARYRFLMAWVEQFLRDEAIEIKMILDDEIWHCHAPELRERWEGERRKRVEEEEEERKIPPIGEPTKDAEELDELHSEGSEAPPAIKSQIGTEQQASGATEISHNVKIENPEKLETGEQASKETVGKVCLENQIVKEKTLEEKKQEEGIVKDEKNIKEKDEEEHVKDKPEVVGAVVEVKEVKEEKLEEEEGNVEEMMKVEEEKEENEYSEDNELEDVNTRIPEEHVDKKLEDVGVVKKEKMIVNEENKHSKDNEPEGMNINIPEDGEEVMIQEKGKSEEAGAVVEKKVEKEEEEEDNYFVDDGAEDVTKTMIPPSDKQITHTEKEVEEKLEEMEDEKDKVGEKKVLEKVVEEEEKNFEDNETEDVNTRIPEKLVEDKPEHVGTVKGEKMKEEMVEKEEKKHSKDNQAEDMDIKTPEDDEEVIIQEGRSEEAGVMVEKKNVEEDKNMKEEEGKEEGIMKVEAMEKEKTLEEEKEEKKCSADPGTENMEPRGSEDSGQQENDENHVEDVVEVVGAEVLKQDEPKGVEVVKTHSEEELTVVDHHGTLDNTSAKHSQTTWSEYTMNELTVAYPKDIFRELNECSLILDDTLQEFHSNFKHFTSDELQWFGVKPFILSNEDDVSVETNKMKLRSLSNYVKIHPSKKLYLRAIPTSTNPKSRRVFTDEVLEIIQILLKIHENDARLHNYRRKWPADIHMTIGLTELTQVLEDFDVDKRRITIIPDATHEMFLYRVLTEPEPLFLELPSTNKSFSIARPHQVIYFLFRYVVCKLNWMDDTCQDHQNCLEGFRKMVLDKMRHLAEFDEHAYISTARMSHIMKDLSQQCRWRTTPAGTPLITLPGAKHDDLIHTDRLRGLSAQFGLEDLLKRREEWKKEKIEVGLARYLFLVAWKEQFLRGEAEEIGVILDKEISYCDAPREEKIKKPWGVEEKEKGEKKEEKENSEDIKAENMEPKTPEDGEQMKNTEEIVEDEPENVGAVEEQDGKKEEKKKKKEDMKKMDMEDKEEKENSEDDEAEEIKPKTTENDEELIIHEENSEDAGTVEEEKTLEVEMEKVEKKVKKEEEVEEEKKNSEDNGAEGMELKTSEDGEKMKNTDENVEDPEDADGLDVEQVKEDNEKVEKKVKKEEEVEEEKKGSEDNEAENTRPKTSEDGDQVKEAEELVEDNLEDGEVVEEEKVEEKKMEVKEEINKMKCSEDNGTEDIEAKTPEDGEQEKIQEENAEDVGAVEEVEQKEEMVEEAQKEKKCSEVRGPAEMGTSRSDDGEHGNNQGNPLKILEEKPEDDVTVLQDCPHKDKDEESKIENRASYSSEDVETQNEEKNLAQKAEDEVSKIFEATLGLKLYKIDQGTWGFQMETTEKPDDNVETEKAMESSSNLEELPLKGLEAPPATTNRTGMEQQAGGATEDPDDGKINNSPKKLEAGEQVDTQAPKENTGKTSENLETDEKPEEYREETQIKLKKTKGKTPENPVADEKQMGAKEETRGAQMQFWEEPMDTVGGAENLEGKDFDELVKEEMKKLESALENLKTDLPNIPKPTKSGPLHVEITSPVKRVEMKDSGYTEPPVLLESAPQKSISWKDIGTQTTLEEKSSESKTRDKEIENLKRANLQMAQQNKNQMSQLENKLETTTAQMTQRITELEEELKAEREKKVATPCHNEEMEELKRTIKVLQDSNNALTIQNEEKANMIKMLLERMGPVPASKE